jgi:LuxR family transcriptional regulator, maltose regulon positive regulatory protein
MPRADCLPPSKPEDVSGPGGLLERKDLLYALERAVAKRVTVIAAPPGSGKTSLLRVWTDSWADMRRVAYVPVARDQQDAALFWSRVLEAIRVAGRPGGPGGGPAATSSRDEDDAFENVISELAEQTDPLVLIVDDLHELRSPEALDQLAQLLRDAPAAVSVVLSSRRDPPIRLHRLRLAHEVTEIRAADLRFTEEETRAILAASGIPLSDAGAAALHRRADGWAAALRLAVISLGDHPDPERFVAEFSGTDRAIGEYLMAEMLERQPDDAVDMLLRTSIVDRVNGELADLLGGRPGSEQILLELEEANAFVVSLDPGRTWFRYHQLFADFLRLELRRTLADEVPELHRRAARWFAGRGEVVEAVDHRLAAGERADAARMVGDHSAVWVLEGELGTMRAALQAFPEGASVDHPDLALAQAAVELSEGHMEEAMIQVTLAESQVDSATPARRHHLEAAIAWLRLAQARRSGRFAEVIELVNLLDASIADESGEPAAIGSELRGIALLNLGIVEIWTGRFADAQRHLSEGVALAERIGRPYLEVACRAHQVFPSRLVSIATALDNGRQAVALAERHGLADRPVIGAALGSIGGISVWKGEFEQGEQWLARAWEVSQAGVDPALDTFLHWATGMLHAGRGRHQPALEEFVAATRAQSRLTGVHGLAPRIAGWLAATQGRLGMLDEARATLEAYSPEPEPRGAIGNARAAIALTEEDPAAALDALEDVWGVNSPGVPGFTLVEAHLLAAKAHLLSGDRDSAAGAVEAALAAAEPDRLIFAFALTDAGDLLDVLPRHATHHGALLADIVDLLEGAPAPRGERRPDTEELSRSELRVLRYLPTNLTRPEIAQALYVSVNTVNTHIRNIYSKLDAHDRSSAVERARELRLLSSGRPVSST